MFPDLVALRKLTGTITITGVDAGGSKRAKITLPHNYLVIGMPRVSTETTDAEVEVVNGGGNEFEVKAINNGASAQDVVINYEVYVLVGV